MQTRLNREAIVDFTLGNLAEYWFRGRCVGCTLVSSPPLKLPAKRRTAASSALGQLLRCSRCQSSSAEVSVVDNPFGGGDARVESVP